jgi:cytochrome oxidase Cu insertion factor (SCO1/SenC/PrrC family)
MSILLSATFLLALVGPPPAPAPAPRRMMSEEDFVKMKPTLGDTIPDLTVYDSAGKEVKTSSLRGHYTVLVFGCLT